MMAHSKVLSEEVKPTNIDVAGLYSDLKGVLNLFASGSGIHQKIFTQSFMRSITAAALIDRFVTGM